MKPRPSRTINLAKCSKAVRDLNPHLSGASNVGQPAPQHGLAPRLKPSEGSDTPPGASTPKYDSRLEAEFAAYLEREKASSRILHHRYTLLLAEGLRYTPDFAEVHADGRVDFYECKGRFLFGGASASHTRATLTKPRTAAEIFPHHRFFIVTKNKESGGFNIDLCQKL